MRNIIKRKEVIAYKGMEFNMTCKGFQYEIEKTYKTDNVELCKCGFHACLNPIDVLDYYSKYKASRFFKVKLSGEITKCGFEDTKVAATEITILEEINIDEALNITEWWKNDNVLDLLYYHEGFVRVQREDGLRNFIDKKGKFLSNEWFKDVSFFHEGFAIVEREDGLRNFIDRKGNYLSDEWFKDVSFFNEGFARVQRRSDYLFNFIDKQGNYLSNEWFKWLDTFKDGFAIVEREDGLRNFIDRKGNYLSNEWFKWLDNFYEGFAEVKRTNGEWCKIDKTGKLIKLQ